MKDFLSRLQAQFQKYWRRLSMPQKIVVSFLSLLILASLVAISFYLGRPDYVPLFTNLTPEDANRIVTKLKEAKVRFQITQGGTAIHVPAKDVYEMRISLAAEGLPQGGSIGFEIFDKPVFGMTEFAQRLNFQRALQGELERSIRQINAVEQARVHLVLPEKELYIEEEKEPSASVILKLKPGFQLDKSQIKAIVNLIKTGVEGLKEQNISIIDTRGTLLYQPWAEAKEVFSPEMISSYFELKRMIEEDIEKEVSTMLAGILGPGKAVVRANVELDLVKKESTEEKYSPVEGTKDGGIIRSQQKRSEYFKGTGPAAAVGVPGAAANIGNVPGYQQVQPGGTSTYTKDDSVINYEINKQVAHLVSLPGEIKRLSIAVLLDGNLSTEKISTIKQAVSSGIGLNLARGDQVLVESLTFDKSYLEQEKREMERLAKREMFSVVLKTGSVIFVILVIFFFFLSMLRHFQVMRKATMEIKKTREAIPAVPPAVSVPTVPVEMEVDVKAQIEALAKEKPERVAEVIRDWITK